VPPQRRPKGSVVVIALALALFMAASEQAEAQTKQGAEKLTPAQIFSATLKKAESGDAESQNAVGEMYHRGEGVPKNAAKANEFYQRAATQGHEWAQLALGFLYLRGKGAPKSASKSAEWYQKAATQGNAMAQYELGVMYDHGEGVPKDAYKAFEWYQKSAAQGFSNAQGNLAVMYSLGRPILKDRVLGYAWFNLSATGGSTKSTEARQHFEKALSREELAEAQRLSSNWKKGQLFVREGKPTTASTTAASGSPIKQGTGTAFLVSKNGQAITNHHVIDGCREVRAEGRDGVVKIITSDIVNDLALLHISGEVNATATITADPAKLRQGEDIVVFGFPLNSVLSSGGNLTPGVVSALTGLGNNTSQIQITAPIQPGSSGSPVLNKKGEVVGVVSMKLSDSKMAKATGQVGQTVNFAVNGQTLKSFLDAHKVTYDTGSFFSREKGTATLLTKRGSGRSWWSAGGSFGGGRDPDGSSQPYLRPLVRSLLCSARSSSTLSIVRLAPVGSVTEVRPLLFATTAQPRFLSC
jgi:S1-C subfamily serine protease